ncbi:MAG: hypothetical protein IT445_14495 [Phycisphaeraceae bacterium]|nr:hypothetical protein [Phycisphaeraceae bacterium]
MKMLKLMTAMTFLLTGAGPLLAQETAKIGNNTQPVSGGTAVVFAFFLVVCVGVAGFMTPKRGHQD